MDDDRISIVILSKSMHKLVELLGLNWCLALRPESNVFISGNCFNAVLFLDSRFKFQDGTAGQGLFCRHGNFLIQ